MFLTGRSDIQALSQAPAVIVGKTYDYLTRRGINASDYANKEKI
jgi:hypothetical protein